MSAALYSLGAGPDLFAAASVEIPPDCWAEVPAVAQGVIPSGIIAGLRPRLGLSGEKGVSVLGATPPDAGLNVVLCNRGAEPFVIEEGERIGQIIAAAALTMRRCSR